MGQRNPGQFTQDQEEVPRANSGAAAPLDLAWHPVHPLLDNARGCSVKRLLFALSIACMASLLTFGWAGTAHAHGAHGAHDPVQLEQTDRSQSAAFDHRPHDTQLPCHCKGSMTCVQLIEAPQPLLLALEQTLSSDRPVFEQRFERSVLVPTDPPPPRI